MTDQIESQQATQIAKATLIDFVTAQPATSEWSVGNLPEGGPDALFGKAPVKIYDLNGEVLFNECNQGWANGQEVTVRVASKRSLGSPVFTIGINSPLSIEDRIVAAKKSAAANGLRVERTRTARVICYSYPKLGIRAESRTGKRFIIDLGDYSIVDPERTPSRTETQFAWSFLESIAGFNTIDRRARYSHNLATIQSLDSATFSVTELDSLPSSSPPQAIISGLELDPQQDPEWCAVAVAEMILAHWQVKKTQPEIAAAMNVGAGQAATSNDQIKAYASLSTGTLTATLDSSASFKTACTEISAGRPVKSAIPGHARLMAGWRTQQEKSSTSQTDWLYLYDPWPQNAGRIYWETWDAITHTNFVYVVKTPA